MVVAVERASPACCSPQQKQFLNRLCSSGASIAQSPTYSLQWQLSSSFTSYDRVAYTWQAVASHHPLLRTSITFKDDSFHLEVRNRASRIQIKPLHGDLPQKPNLNIAELIVCVEDTTVSLRLRIQQALVDRPSLARIRNDFQLFYDGLACEPQNPFGNYLSHLQCRDQQSAFAFWRETMSGAVTSLTYGIPTGLGGKQRSYHNAIGAALLEDMESFCEAYNVTTSQFFHAVWALVQYRHTAATDGSVVFQYQAKISPFLRVISMLA